MEWNTDFNERPPRIDMDPLDRVAEMAIIIIMRMNRNSNKAERKKRALENLERGGWKDVDPGKRKNKKAAG